MYLPKRIKARRFAPLQLLENRETVQQQHGALMTSRQRLKPVSPLKSALPDVFLRKNKFEERMLQNKQKFLEKAERKVIDRLAREQEEFAILNCVCIGSGAETFGGVSNSFGEGKETLLSDERTVDKNPSQYTGPANSNKEGDQSFKYRNNGEEDSAGEIKIRHKRNGFRRSKSDSALRKMSRTDLQKSPATQNIEARSNKDGNCGKLKSNENQNFCKPPLRSAISLPAGSGLGLKEADENSSGMKIRAKSAPAKRARVAFSGRDGRQMSLTPVIRQFSQVSLNDACSTSFRPNTAVKTIRDLPRVAQVQLKSSVYFLSQHKIKQQNEMTKIRTRRAMSAAQTSRY